MAKHVVLLGYSAYGHMIPFLSLAKKLAAAGCKVTLTTSAVMLDQLRKRGNLCDADEKLFDTFGIEDGIEESDTAFALPKLWSHVIPALEKYVESLLPGTDSPTSSGVDLLVGDMFNTPIASVARKLGIPFYLFYTSPVILLNTLLCIDESTPEATTELLETFLPNGDGLKRGEVKTPVAPMLKKVGLDVGRATKDFKGVLVNSFRELEGDTIDQFLSNTGRDDLELYCIGPVFPEEPKRTQEEQAVRDKVQSWLDHKKPGTVTYVAFGSIVTFGAAQLRELGEALLGLNAPFIYSIRTESQTNLPEEMRARIPLQLVKPDSPWLVLNWAPQDLILSHPSVQVFVTHCGWNSTVESVAAKKPTCMWPMFADQMDNARIMKRCGMGVLVTGEGEHYNKSVSAGKIQESVREVGGGTSEKTSYAKAAEIWGEKMQAAVSSNGSSQKEFADFLRHC